MGYKICIVFLIFDIEDLLEPRWLVCVCVCVLGDDAVNLSLLSEEEEMLIPYLVNDKCRRGHDGGP